MMTSEDSQYREADLGILLAMTHIAWADRTLTEGELELIKEEMDDQGLSEEEQDTVIVGITEPDQSISELPQMLPDKTSRLSAAFSAYITALADHALSTKELQAFNDLCGVLEISEGERQRLRAAAELETTSQDQDGWNKNLLLENLLGEPFEPEA